GTGVDPDRALTLLVSSRHRELQLHRALVTEQQRPFQGQFLHDTGTDPLTSRQRHLQKARARHQHLTHDRVIPQPVLTLEREPPGEQPTLLITSQMQSSAQQGMFTSTHTERARVRHTSRALQPVTTALKSISRKLNTPLRA